MNMDLGAISARAGAPNDGLKKGANDSDSERVAAGSTEIALWSKQNSDATGMRYQWGRKDPFTFATSSEPWGGGGEYGKYPVKLYNSSSVLIYQVDNGGDNTGKLPSGGVLAPWTVASSMSVAIANPITFYCGNPYTIISQSGQSRDLYDYYCTSYSRGTDGEGHWNADAVNKPNVHNLYLDSYIPLRHKSIYDPCPYGYRTPSNGTYNEFTTTRWTKGSNTGGFIMNFTSSSWIVASATKTGTYTYAGSSVNLFTSTIVSVTSGYSFWYIYAAYLRNTWRPMNQGISIRCIEDCSVVSDATEASAGY